MYSAEDRQGSIHRAFLDGAYQIRFRYGRKYVFQVIEGLSNLIGVRDVVNNDLGMAGSSLDRSYHGSAVFVGEGNFYR